MTLSLSELRAHRREQLAKRAHGATAVESKLWDIAESSPYGNKLITANNEGDPYLLRTYLSPDRKVLERQLTDGLGLQSETLLRIATYARPYLHFFFRGDEDREVHNHPWRRAVSLILVGGYKEYRWVSKYQKFSEHILKPGSLNLIGKKDFHRVELDQAVGCWTLFFSMDRMEESNGQDWHFLDTSTGEMIPWGSWDSRRSKPGWRADGADRNDHT